MKYEQKSLCLYTEYCEKRKRKTRRFLGGIGTTLLGVLTCLAIEYLGNKDSELIFEKPKTEQKKVKKIEKILNDGTLDRIHDNLERRVTREAEQNMRPAKEYKISINGIELVKKFEGFRENAYLCPAGVWTIGYGHTENVKEGDTITEKKATEYLISDLEKTENAIRKKVQVSLTQNQYDALVSFVYNVGENAFGKSTLLRKLNEKDYDGAANEFEKWNKITVNGEKKVCQGLVERRTIEKEYFLGGSRYNDKEKKTD